MKRERIKEMIKRFLKQKYRETGEKWVMTNCPLAPYTHADGDDRKYSFGISTDGGFNCFTCGIKGPLSELPRLLAKYTHTPMFALEDFIREHLFEPDEITNQDEPTTFLDARILDLYPFLPDGVLNLSRKDIKKWNVRFDEATQQALFPIYVDGKLNAIKVRGIKDKFFYTIGKLCIKKTGNWYGEQFKPKKFLALVEGERDAILLSRYITSWASLGAPTNAQLHYIRNFATAESIKLILFFDNDEAGEKMKQKAIKILGATCELYFISDYCGCKDPAELVEKRLIKKALYSIKKI